MPAFHHKVRRQVEPDHRGSDALPGGATREEPLALLAAMHRAGNRSPDALNCDKLGSFVQGDASELPSLCTECATAP